MKLSCIGIRQDFETKSQPLVRFLYKIYFRIQNNIKIRRELNHILF